MSGYRSYHPTNAIPLHTNQLLSPSFIRFREEAFRVPSSFVWQPTLRPLSLYPVPMHSFAKRLRYLDLRIVPTGYATTEEPNLAISSVFSLPSTPVRPGIQTRMTWFARPILFSFSLHSLTNLEVTTGDISALTILNHQFAVWTDMNLLPPNAAVLHWLQWVPWRFPPERHCCAYPGYARCLYRYLSQISQLPNNWFRSICEIHQTNFRQTFRPVPETENS